MTNVVIQVSHDHLLKIKQSYSSFLKDKLPLGALFIAKKNNITITGYHSGKVMFQGQNAEKEATKWESNPKSHRKNSKINAPLPPHFEQKNIIGSDEVGTGDFFGPIVVCATYVDQENIPLLKSLGVRDSKMITDNEINNIAKKIITHIPYSLLLCPNEKYNAAQADGMNQGQMKALLHNKALENVLKKIAPIKPEAILIDQFVEQNIYYRYLNHVPHIIRENVFFETKAEQLHVAVAAASILARFQFLNCFTTIESKLGIKIPKGAGEKVDQVAAQIIGKYGTKTLFKYTKMHFANTQKAKAIANQSKEC